MKSSLKVIIVILIIFGLFSIGTEVYRVFKLHVDIEEEILVMALDSIELSIDDKYRHDHISIMDTRKCDEMFFKQFKEKYRLNNSLEPVGEHFISEPININELEYIEGEFEIQGGKPVQTINPSMYIKGSFVIKPLIIDYNNVINVPFEIFAENQRID